MENLDKVIKETMLNPKHEVHLDLSETLEKKDISTYRKLKNYLYKNFHIDLDIDRNSDYYEDLFWNSDLRSRMGFMLEFGVFIVFPEYYIDRENPESEYSKMWRELVRQSTIIMEDVL